MKNPARYARRNLFLLDILKQLECVLAYTTIFDRQLMGKSM